LSPPRATARRGAHECNDLTSNLKETTTDMTTRLRAAIAALCVLAVTAPATVASAKGTGNETDRAFVREMVPHHQMAVEMAEMARMDADHKKIRLLAKRVIRAQDAEISRMRAIAKTLGVTPEAMPEDGQMSEQMMKDLDTLGVSMDDSGMMMDMHELHGAKPFDRKFIDMMIPHHQGAIRMARAEVAKGINKSLRRLARAVIKDQAKEIRQMNAWRKAWYGGASPAGGVPTA
jgi:uncharacterized protein (DUF305 family)